MAKLSVPTPLSGKIGDQVFTRNRQGTAIRARVTPLNPKTPAQQNHRAIIAAAASQWRALPQSARDAWMTLAAQMNGNLSGFHACLHINITLATLGMEHLETPPQIPAFGLMTFLQPFTATHAAAAPHALLLDAPFTNTIPPDAYLYQATAPVSPGRCNVTNLFRIIYRQIGPVAPSPSLLASAYINHFGDPPDGLAISLRITQITKGFRGVPFTFRTIVTQAA